MVLVVNAAYIRKGNDIEICMCMCSYAFICFRYDQLVDDVISVGQHHMHVMVSYTGARRIARAESDRPCHLQVHALMSWHFQHSDSTGESLCHWPRLARSGGMYSAS